MKCSLNFCLQCMSHGCQVVVRSCGGPTRHGTLRRFVRHAEVGKIIIVMIRITVLDNTADFKKYLSVYMVENSLSDLHF